MWLVFAAAFINALLYTCAVSDPLISADNWLFIDTFLRHAVDGTLDLGDFLVKRAGIDHAQPLNKLLMLLNFRIFGLDFAIEGLVGLMFGAAALIVLYRTAIADASLATRRPLFYAAMAATAAVWFSLNSSMIYSFSLVTMGFAPFFFAFLCIWAAWHALDSGRWGYLLIAMLGYGVVGDDAAIILGLALSLLSLAWGWRTGRMALAWRVVLVMLVAIMACRGFYAVFGEIRGATLPEFNVPLGQRVGGLMSQWREGWQWFAIPSASGVAYIAPLQRLVGEHWRLVQTILAVILFAAHGWFWWSAWRVPPRAASFFAVALMLLFYGYLVGLLFGRIFVRGTEYLNQPRYISFYQFNIIALLVMAAARTLAADSGRTFRWAWASAITLLLVQVPLSASAWREVPSIQMYYERMAMQWSALALDPAHPPRDCVPVLTICQMPFDQRVALLKMVREQRINLYSPRFAIVHPTLARAAAATLSNPSPSASR